MDSPAKSSIDSASNGGTGGAAGHAAPTPGAVITGGGGVRIENNALGLKMPLNSFGVRQVVRHPTPVDNRISKRVLKEYLSGAISPFGLELDVWAYKRRELYSLVVAAFEKLHLLSFLNISQQEFVAFVIDVDRGYFDNPYHSFLHGFDIFQIVHYVMIDLHGDYGMTKLDLLGILIAALCHDLAHPGVNNLYQVHASTKLAIMYNDISVLENYSCAMTFALAAKHGIFRHLPQKDYESVRSIIIKAILATDISLHFDLREKFTNFVESYDRSLGPPDAEHKPLILNAVLHMADVSNPARPWSMAKKWSDMVVEEFFLQGDLEKLNSLAPSPNMDRDKTLQPQIALGFQDFIVTPFVNIVSRYLPGLSTFTEYLTQNRTQWQALLEQMKRQQLDNGQLVDMSARDAANLILKQRRLSVASGTVTIPGSVMAKLSPRTTHMRTSSVTSMDRINESDDESVEGIYPWYPELDSALAREITASALQEPALLSQKQNGMLFGSPNLPQTTTFNNSNQLRRPHYTDAERLLTKSVCMLQLSSMLLQESNDDAAWIFTHVPAYIKRVFSAHSVMLAVFNKTHERLQTWVPAMPKSKSHDAKIGDGHTETERREPVMKRQNLNVTAELATAFRVTAAKDNDDAAAMSPRTFQHTQKPGHRLIVPLVRQKRATEHSIKTKRQSLAVHDSSDGSASSPTQSPVWSPALPLMGSPQPPPVGVSPHAENLVGVVDIYRMTAFGPAEADLAACLCEMLASALAKAHYHNLIIKKERKNSTSSNTSNTTTTKRSPDDTETGSSLHLKQTSEGTGSSSRGQKQATAA